MSLELPFSGPSLDPTLPGFLVTSPTGPAALEGNSNVGIGVAGSGVTGVRGDSSDGNGNGVFGKNDAATASGVAGESANGIGVFGQGATGVRGQSSGNGNGVFGKSDAATASGVAGESANGIGVFGQGVTGVRGQSFGTNGNGVFGKSDAGETSGVAGESQNGNGVFGSSQSGIAVFGKGGRLAGRFEGDVEVTGNLNLSSATSDIFLGDVAEGFSTGDGETIGPGTVVVLDYQGRVRPGDEAYDKKVAGVVSGAGDYRPAIVLDKQRSGAMQLPVALIGKVCCMVDAQYSSIEVGDMLTTSPTPGHAMKAVDPLKAFGAVIGKALRPLHAGQGVIPILIALQ